MYGKLATALVVAGMTAMVMGYATFAYFSDSGTSSDNVFSAGTVELTLSDDDQSFADSVTQSFGGSVLAPGDSGSSTIEATDNSTITQDRELDIVFCNVGTGTPDLADLLEFNVTYGTDTLFATGNSTTIHDTVFTVTDTSGTLGVDWEFIPSANGDSNPYQGATSTWTVHFILRQAIAPATTAPFC